MAWQKRRYRTYAAYAQGTYCFTDQLANLSAHKPRMLVALALANKMARAIWAMLTRQENFRDPAPATVA